MTKTPFPLEILCFIFVHRCATCIIVFDNPLLFTVNDLTAQYTVGQKSK